MVLSEEQQKTLNSCSWAVTLATAVFRIAFVLTTEFVHKNLAANIVLIF